ncbi:hypothetical protein [Rhodanobacter sp. A1T4]|uniref:hypothetical protein n=1 Tax=Rhodanobacter sp. A1T4 TaxID=2723087 RepID=UPI00161759AF|nr:hypothetical protein [Rhodanobacter sp. A1T4]MBB6249158.1 hypothetical protein [Rhodanobacter sp. A1T4]
MKAVLLGAGASYECGMPLVWEFTNVLRANVLKRLDSKLFDFRERPEFRVQFESILKCSNLHYEQMIGELESIYLARGPNSAVAYNAALQLLDCVQILLFEDELRTAPMLAAAIPDYRGLQNLVARHPGLDIFSLNHDQIIEEVCGHFEVPFRDGFYEGQGSRYEHITNFKTLTEDQINHANFNFFGRKDYGVNLIKLHGSLDLFAVEDKRLYLKCAPISEEGFGGCLRSLFRVESHSVSVCHELGTRSVRELIVRDRDGEIQFFRRSLLSGAHKFKGHFEQVAPVALFEEFKRRLSGIVDLDVIGYGFGDAHINDVLASWLQRPESRINIYDPHRDRTPAPLEPWSERVGIFKFGLTGYLEPYSDPLTRVIDRGRRKALRHSRDKLRATRLAQWPTT